MDKKYSELFLATKDGLIPTDKYNMPSTLEKTVSDVGHIPYRPEQADFEADGHRKIRQAGVWSNNPAYPRIDHANEFASYQ
jgi:hypothetical protein